MNGVLVGWLTTLVVGLGVVLMLALAAALVPRAVRMRTASFVCPWWRCPVTVRYLTCDGTHPVGVVSCSAFADPTVVTCGTPCVSGGLQPGGLAPVRPAGELLAE